MGNNKKKKTILISSIGVVVVIAIALLAMFLLTDIFKTPQQLFYKYLPQNMQFLDIISSNLSASYNQKMQQNSYASTGEISVTYEMGNGDSQEASNNSELIKIVTDGKVDKKNQKQYNKVTLTQNSQEMFAVKYLRNSDLYALGSDEIVTKYVAVENNNLKDLATKLGFEDVSQIPNKIEENYDLESLLQITDEEKEYISEVYGSLIVKNIDKNNFTKTKNVNITVDSKNYQTQKYTLTLTSQQVKDIAVKILRQLQNDDKVLNIILNKYYMIVQNQEMTIEMLKQNIQELQQNINNQEFADIQIQTSLYVLDNNLMKTEIAFGEYLISMNYNSNENKLIIKNETGDIEGFDTIEVKKSESEEQYVLSIDVTNSNNIENSIKLQLSRVGKTSSNTIRDLAILTINAENSVYSVKYSNNINFENNIEIEELNQDNSIILNTYSGEEVKNLLIAIEDRTKQVWNEKMQMLGSGGEEGTIIEEFTNQENSDELAQNQETELTATEKLAIEMYNEQFLAYLGESVSADNVKKLLSVTRGAIQNQNHINVKYSGTYNNTAVEKEVSTIEDVEALDIYIVNGKSYFVEGVADYTGKLEALTIKENEN